MPRAIGGEIGSGIGEQLNEALDDLKRSEFESFAGLVSKFAGEEAGDIIVAVGNAIIEDPSIDDAIDHAATGTGEAVGDHFGHDLHGPLEFGGERLIDPRYEPGLDIEGRTPFGDLDVELKMRGPVYFVSLAVENMLLNGQEDLVNGFLEAVEEAARRAGRSDG